MLQNTDCLLFSRLQNLDGDWHEFESKALRRENERKEKEAKRAQVKDATAAGGSSREGNKDRKRPNDTNESHRDPKRPHVNPKQPSHSDRGNASGLVTGSSTKMAPNKA